MTYIDCIPEAIDMVSAWDLPEDELISCINEQAHLMVGIDEYYEEYIPAYPIQLPLHF